MQKSFSKSKGRNIILHVLVQGTIIMTKQQQQEDFRLNSIVLDLNIGSFVKYLQKSYLSVCLLFLYKSMVL